MSPGDRSYDAIGLLKHISDENAAAYENAQEILRNEAPKGRSQENNDQPSQSQLRLNAVVKLNLMIPPFMLPSLVFNIVRSFVLHDSF